MMIKLKFGPQSPAAPKWAGVLRISGFKLNKKKNILEVDFGSWNVGSIFVKRTEVCEELRKRKVDVCCLQEARWRGEGACFLGVKGRRYTLWWCGNDNETECVGIFVKEKLCENVLMS